MAEITEGTRVRVTTVREGVVRKTGDGSLSIKTDGGAHLTYTSTAGQTVELLSPPLPDEPPEGSYVIDRDGDLHVCDRNLWFEVEDADRVCGRSWERLHELFPPIVRLYRADDPDVVVLDGAAADVATVGIGPLNETHLEVYVYARREPHEPIADTVITNAEALRLAADLVRAARGTS